jgi:hypothetical protein
MTATTHTIHRGEFSNRYVEPYRMVGTARQLAAGASSANTALTAGVSRVSMRAVGADIRFSIGTSAQTASASSHFIADGERLELRIPEGANIAVKRNASTSGVLELSELE